MNRVDSSNATTSRAPATAPVFDAAPPSSIAAHTVNVTWGTNCAVTTLPGSGRRRRPRTRDHAADDERLQLHHGGVLPEHLSGGLALADALQQPAERCFEHAFDEQVDREQAEDGEREVRELPGVRTERGLSGLRDAVHPERAVGEPRLVDEHVAEHARQRERRDGEVVGAEADARQADEQRQCAADERCGGETDGEPHGIGRSNQTT